MGRWGGGVRSLLGEGRPIVCVSVGADGALLVVGGGRGRLRAAKGGALDCRACRQWRAGRLLVGLWFFPGIS